MLPGTMRSGALAKFFMDLEKPKGICSAHNFLYAYVQYIQVPGDNHTSSCFPVSYAPQPIDRYLNEADLTLARIACLCTARPDQEHIFMPESRHDVENHCMGLASCGIRYVLHSPQRISPHLT